VKVNEIGSVAVAALMLAAFAVAVKPGSQTGGVLNAAGSAASNVIKAAAYGR